MNLEQQRTLYQAIQRLEVKLDHNNDCALTADTGEWLDELPPEEKVILSMLAQGMASEFAGQRSNPYWVIFDQLSSIRQSQVLLQIARLKYNPLTNKED